MANQEQIAIATDAERTMAFTTTVVSRTAIKNSNVFLRINKRRDRPGGNTFRRDNIGNGTGRGRRKLWLFNTRCHNHRREEQRAPEKIRCSRQVNRISCVDEPSKNPEEQPRSDNESD